MADAQRGIDTVSLTAALDDWVVGELGAIPLDRGALRRWADKKVGCGWRIRIEVADKIILVDLLIDDGFPFSRPRLAWVDPPPFPSIPHVEPDGRICALGGGATFDPLNPIGVVKHMLSDAARILETGLAGGNADDFRVEFRSYWNESSPGKRVVSMIDPSGPSRRVRAWFGTERSYVADDRKTLRRWLAHAGLKANIADINLKPVALLWLDRPIIPAEYPVSLADLEALCGRCEGDAKTVLDSVLAAEERPLVVLGFPANDDAACFAAVRLEASGGRRRLGHQSRLPGYRAHAPRRLLVGSHRSDQLVRSAVDRADPWWVHGRDANPDVGTLLGCRVAIVGCGSLGSPIARFLAQSGVGHLILIDPETMHRANGGRHQLGADAADFAKAKALRARLTREFPHLLIDAHACSWQSAVAEQPDVFAGCDLIISTIGGWEQEAPLNAFRLVHSDHPPILYAWTEPHGHAGQAVLTGRGSGCLACGLDDHGGAHFRVTNFAATTLRREPACGGFFQPYGGADIATVAALASGLGVDLLCDRAEPGLHRLTASPQAEIERSGGSLTADWIALSSGRALGGNQQHRQWDRRTDCPACAGSGL